MWSVPRLRAKAAIRRPRLEMRCLTIMPLGILVLTNDPVGTKILHPVLNEVGFQTFVTLDAGETVFLCESYGQQIEMLIVNTGQGDVSPSRNGKRDCRCLSAFRRSLCFQSGAGRPVRTGTAGQFGDTLCHIWSLQRPCSAADLKLTIHSILRSQRACPPLCDELQEAALEATYEHMDARRRHSGAEALGKRNGAISKRRARRHARIGTERDKRIKPSRYSSFVLLRQHRAPICISPANGCGNKGQSFVSRPDTHSLQHLGEEWAILDTNGHRTASLSSEYRLAGAPSPSESSSIAQECPRLSRMFIDNLSGRVKVHGPGFP